MKFAKRFYGAVVRLVVRHRLVFAVTAVISVALVSTVVSMSLYISSGASSLDLSRPGYNQARTQVMDIPSESFSPAGMLDQKALEQFDKAYSQQRKTLDSFGRFQDAALDDNSLQITTQQ